MTMNVVQHFGKFVAAIGKSWFSMTRDEQRAVALILSLFILGVSVRYGRMLVGSWGERPNTPNDIGASRHE